MVGFICFVFPHIQLSPSPNARPIFLRKEVEEGGKSLPAIRKLEIRKVKKPLVAFSADTAQYKCLYQSEGLNPLHTSFKYKRHS